MPKTRPPYSSEFRRQMVDLVRAGRDPADLAREFEPTAQSISHWVAQADRQEGRREEKAGGLTAAERDEPREHSPVRQYASHLVCRAAKALPWGILASIRDAVLLRPVDAFSLRR
jgi:transposase